MRSCGFNVSYGFLTFPVETPRTDRAQHEQINQKNKSRPSLSVLEFSSIFVPRITIQAFSSNASRPHSSNHCLQARSIESSFYRILEASRCNTYCRGRTPPENFLALDASLINENQWKSMKINKNPGLGRPRPPNPIFLTPNVEFWRPPTSIFFY